MKQYNRIMLGRGSKFAKICRDEGYIGADFEISEDLTDSLYENWRDFNKKMIPIWMSNQPGKTKTAAGIACGFLWTIAKGLKIGDVVLCPSGEGFYYIGEISSGYYYVPGKDLPHRRKVNWLKKTIIRTKMSKNLQNSTGSIGTCCDISKYADEIEGLLKDKDSMNVEKIHPDPSVTVLKYDERSLHKLFCTYLRDSLDVYAKTIFHEKSTNKDTAKKWVHPDIVGAQFLEFNDESTLSLLKATEPKERVRIYSFELKKKIDSDYQLKQCFFQALSNSSWANYGYLVAFDINDNMDEEMARLNNAFGIGIIHMQAQSNETKILYPAREKSLDFNTIGKLSSINSDFRNFITKLSKYMHASNAYAPDAKLSFENDCDDIFESDEDLKKYCKEKGIPF